VLSSASAGERVAYPDTLVGTDSQTTMINGTRRGRLGCGGIEAEAVMLGQPLYMLMPEVMGFKITGALRDGVTATDLVLTVTQMLRKKGVVDKFVEFHGPGLSAMSLPDRATLGNMAPEYGATMGFFPVDAETLRYLERTGRDDAALLVERYCKEQGLFRTDDMPDPDYTDMLSLDLGDVEPSLAGPKRPQDRVPLRDMKASFRRTMVAPVKERGYGIAEAELTRSAKIPDAGATLAHGAVVIAAITSCTNTSNPSVMVGAGLLAKKAASADSPSTVREDQYGARLESGDRVPARGGCTGAAGEARIQRRRLRMYDLHRRRYAGPDVRRTSVAIENLARGGSALFGPTEERQLALATQRRRWIRVARMRRDRSPGWTHADVHAGSRDPALGWSLVRADALDLGRDRVVVGLEAPLDEVGTDENGYVLKAGEMTFTMESMDERSRTLAFARLLGHLLSDGSISVNGQGRMNVGQALDREAALDDIEKLTGKRPAGSRTTSASGASRCPSTSRPRFALWKACVRAGASISPPRCRRSCSIPRAEGGGERVSRWHVRRGWLGADAAASGR
jgi:hypothetical protein